MNANPISGFSQQGFEFELLENILPYWMTRPLDDNNGGFHGALSVTNEILSEIERGSILCSRILWTFSRAYMRFHKEAYQKIAQRAYHEILHRFWDTQYGGVFWSTDLQGQPVLDRKHTYAQAFAIYGLSAYYESTGESKALELAQTLFHLIDTHTFDTQHGGNLECRSRTWEPLTDMRLSDKDLNSHKSMNTLLHLTEAYSALALVWKNTHLVNRLEGLIDVLFDKVIDTKSGHQRLFFSEDWKSLSDHVSYGHDIETSWLLYEAAIALGDPHRIKKAQSLGMKMAQTVYNEALHADGSVLYEASPNGFRETSKPWWAHAEAVVGFYHAFQQSGENQFLEASKRVWSYIQDRFIDRTNGDWYKLLNADGNPVLTHTKVGPWDCPYHHARMCLEMMNRLGNEEKQGNIR